MNRQLFDKAIGEVPPSTVDVDGVIARERRAALVRRVANPWVATAAGVVAVSFGIAAAVFPPGSGDAGLNVGSTPTSRTRTTIPKPPTPAAPTCVPAPAETPDAAEPRLTEVLNRVVRNHVPAGMELVPNPGAQDPIGTQRGPLEAYYVEGARAGACGGADGHFLAMANVIRGAERGNIAVVMQTPDSHGLWWPECMDNGAVVDRPLASCDRQRRPDGVIVVMSTWANMGGSTTHEVQVAKPDGTFLMITAENVSNTSKMAGAPESPAPPLTMDQLITIALDPGMTLYP